MKRPFIISIAAPSGGGKTTIVGELKKRLAKSAVLYWDDYGDEVDPDRDINDVQNYNEWNTKPMAADIVRLLNEPHDYIILDYPFGYMNDGVAKYINLSVFIDTPLDVAMARRIIRDYTSRSTENDFGLADVDEVSLKAIDEELRWYLTRSRPTYARFSKSHKSVSDFVVDGAKTPEEIVEIIVEYIERKEKSQTKKSLPLIRHFSPLTLFLYGTYKEDGTPNFGLFSWLNYCVDDGVGVIACIAGEKLTKDRIRANKVFSANLVTEDLLPLADYFGNTSGYKQGKMNIPVETIKGQVLDVPILVKSPWAYELEVTQSFELDGSTVFICKVRNVLANESIYDEPENVERWMNIIRPIKSVRQSYFKWDGTTVGSFGEPMKAIKTLDESGDMQ